MRNHNRGKGLSIVWNAVRMVTYFVSVQGLSIAEPVDISKRQKLGNNMDINEVIEQAKKLGVIDGQVQVLNILEEFSKRPSMTLSNLLLIREIVGEIDNKRNEHS